MDSIRDEFIFIADNGDEESYYDIWLEAYQQACAIAFNMKFETPEAYTDYVLDLTDKLYENILKESE